MCLLLANLVVRSVVSKDDGRALLGNDELRAVGIYLIGGLVGSLAGLVVDDVEQRGGAGDGLGGVGHGNLDDELAYHALLGDIDVVDIEEDLGALAGALQTVALRVVGVTAGGDLSGYLGIRHVEVDAVKLESVGRECCQHHSHHDEKLFHTACFLLLIRNGENGYPNEYTEKLINSIQMRLQSYMFSGISTIYRTFFIVKVKEKIYFSTATREKPLFLSPRGAKIKELRTLMCFYNNSVYPILKILMGKTRERN